MTLGTMSPTPTETRPPAAPSAPAGVRLVRVLHVLGQLNRGGVETWLMNVLRSIDRSAFRMDFLVQRTEPGAYDDEARQLGSDVIPCPAPDPLTFARNFRRVLRQRGPYDVVHSHVHAYSGWVLRLAAKEGVPVRIAHSHTDRSNVESERTLRRRAYRALMGHLIRRHATAGIGISEAATSSFYGQGWRRDPRWRVLYYGMDFSRIRGPHDRAAIRAELGLPPDAMVITSATCCPSRTTRCC